MLLRFFVFSAALWNFTTGPSPWSSRMALPLPLLVCLYIVSIWKSKSARSFSDQSVCKFIRSKIKHPQRSVSPLRDRKHHIATKKFHGKCNTKMLISLIQNL